MTVIEILTMAGSLLGLATGTTALVSFSRKVRSEAAAELSKAKREAEEEGRRKERDETMKKQIDAAHDEIRRLSERQDELSEAVIGIQADMKNAVRMLERLDQKFDRYAEAGR